MTEFPVSSESLQIPFKGLISVSSLQAVSWLPRWARVILDKSPDDRTEKDLRHLHALLRGMKSFDTFTEKVQLSMCRSFTYQ